ncbi:MAG: DUF3099 domain-containing protein [Sporichthyaceae bacterium]|nr:DUF3099 domain-containing protein [Sporichthyaceae bacterium]
MRTGNEPSQARSPLRLRLTLAIFGLAGAIAGCTIFAALDAVGWLIACVLLGLIAIVDIVVVLGHIHAGAHYQPGRSIPPYRPVEGGAMPRSGRAALSLPQRRRRYLILMATCVVLFVSSWTWVRLYSQTAAVVMSVIAMTIPPIAAIVANAGRRL